MCNEKVFADLRGHVGTLPFWDNGDIKLYAHNVNEADTLWKNGELEKAYRSYKTILNSLSEDMSKQAIKLRLCLVECELGLEDKAIQEISSIFTSLGLPPKDVKELFFTTNQKESTFKALQNKLPKLKAEIFAHPLKYTN